MKQPTEQSTRPMHLRRKLMSALSMLLVATILMTSTSYAWFVMSTAPEVTGISTNIGANGSLEIALLNTETHADMSTIRSGVGDSLASNNPLANYAWGNLVDLSLGSFGLDSILLMPARINANTSGDIHTVETGMLSIPTYGYDGRVMDLTDNTFSAAYLNQAFSFVMGQQDYGVRAIGTADSLSVQGSALALAKSNIATYTNSAKTNARNVLSNNGDALFEIMMTHSINASSTYGNSELETLKKLLSDLQSTLDYIDLALRQGIVAFAASEIGSEDTFNQVKDRVMDTAKTLDQIIADLGEVGTVPGAYGTWIDALSDTQNDLNSAINASNELSGGSYTWQEFRGILDYIMNVDNVYIGDTLFGNMSSDTLQSLIGGDVKLTLAPGSGVFADIADFTGDISSVMTVFGTNIEITTLSTVDPYLTVLAAQVKDLEAADGTGEEGAVTEMTTTYGYALDLAFRCNAANADLLLQTAPEQRVYEGSTAGSTQGGGSYMEFTSTDETLTLEQRLKLMDAIRVAFLDDQSTILGIGKLNTSNRSIVDGMINAPLYLYDYTFEEDTVGHYLQMGERRNTDNQITTLEQNTPKALTVMVWLDGDLVDNTMVSATEAASLGGVLNLQFSTSAALVPAENSALLNYTADKTGLEALITENQPIAEAGQGTYTNVSWNAFLTAYTNAVALNNDMNPAENQIQNAMLSLAKAASGLEVVSQEPVRQMVQTMRQEMGESEDLGRYVIVDENGAYQAVGEFTEEEYDGFTVKGEVNQVSYDNNLEDSGDGVSTKIYTDNSWSAAASALYDAEAVILNKDATEDQLNAALSALEISRDAMEREVYFKPYDYRGAIYYEAICDAGNTDTYGKWYDASFKRVTSDLTILNLDAYAEPADISGIGDNKTYTDTLYVEADTSGINPYINIFDSVYTELNGETVKGAMWGEIDGNLFTEVMDQRHVAELNSLMAIVRDESLTVDTADAQDLITRKNNGETVSLAEAEAAISALNADIVAALEQKAKDEAEQDTSMTSSQRILLTKAVSTATAVEGYNNAENVEDAMVSLRTAAEAAQELLSSETAVTSDQAAKVLNDLNAALTGVKAEQVTEYNTIVNRIPTTSELYDIVYDVEYPSISLNLNGNLGGTTLGATILTKNGIVTTVEKNVVVYHPASGVQILDEGEAAVTSLSLTAKDTAKLTAELTHTKTDEELTIGGRWCGETIKSCTWASTDMDVVTVSGDSSNGCTINAQARGTARITLSVVTVQGHAYTCQFVVNVTE